MNQGFEEGFKGDFRHCVRQYMAMRECCESERSVMDVLEGVQLLLYYIYKITVG